MASFSNIADTGWSTVASGVGRTGTGLKGNNLSGKQYGKVRDFLTRLEQDDLSL